MNLNIDPTNIQTSTNLAKAVISEKNNKLFVIIAIFNRIIVTYYRRQFLNENNIYKKNCIHSNIRILPIHKNRTNRSMFF